MRKANPVRRGVTLIEILCVIVLLAVVTAVLMLLINHTLEAQRIQSHSYETLQQSKALADQLRADVARAKSTLKQWREYTSDVDTLILRTTEEETIVYTKAEGGLLRIAAQNDQQLERPTPLPEGTAIEFVQAERIIRVRLTPARGGKAHAGQSLEIAAALGGDWR
jgi:prepilin-type N-terminal cleavage/methylation domain-containing protein